MRNSALGLLAAGTISLFIFQTPVIENSLLAIIGTQSDSTKSQKITSQQLNYTSKGRHVITHSDEKSREDISFEGKITISKDFTDIESILPNGHLTYVSTMNDETRRIEIKSDAQGNLVRVYKENGKVMPFETGGRLYLQQLMPGLMAATGIGIEDFIKSVYQKTGLDGVLNEAEKLAAPYVKVAFVKHVFKLSDLKPSEVKRAMEYVDSFTNSAYERRSMLTSIPVKNFNDAEVVNAYLKVAEKIESAYESRLTLEHLLSTATISKTNLSKALQQAGNIISDYEKANLLERLIERKDFLTDHYSGTLAAIAQIGSDYEKSKTLSQILKAHQLDSGQYRELLTVISTVGSAYEKSKLLQSLIDRKDLSPDALSATLTATAEIHSDYEKSKTISLLLKVHKLNVRQYEALFPVITTIGSDYEKSKVLQEIALKLPADATALRESYYKTANSIGSDYERGRALGALK